MITAEAIDDLADRYLAAEADRIALEPLSVISPHLTVEEAYRVQMAIVARKVGAGERIAGRKVGATNEAIQRAMKIGEPIYGHLFSGQRISNGAEVSLSELIHPRVEGEIAFTLRRDLEGPGVTAADALDAVGTVAAAIEINDSRTRGWDVGMREVVADNGVAARFLLGEGRPADGLDLREVRVVMEKNGEEAARSSGAAILGDPALSLAWLANKIGEGNGGLRAGEVVLAGSMTPMAPVAVGDLVEASFEGLGSLSVRFR
ncbi:fumarylacetoacetate hydrolase family protein [Methanotrichaceae archaeon Mx]|uniref:Fumarylacetoacetate hydrolase family protein n=2 Tax=Candidatus Methanocrinis natronophilus TaxID=3033396 RepID=A0ABT5X6S7_9EURY|nr:fumarylacetoacetate hydrolase family protein [Candidatus Methanocrinis natronophilus]